MWRDVKVDWIGGMYRCGFGGFGILGIEEERRRRAVDELSLALLSSFISSFTYLFIHSFKAAYNIYYLSSSSILFIYLNRYIHSSIHLISSNSVDPIHGQVFVRGICCTYSFSLLL